MSGGLHFRLLLEHTNDRNITRLIDSSQFILSEEIAESGKIPLKSSYIPYQ